MLQKERKVFIGSSSEGRQIADIVSDALSRSNNKIKNYKLEPCLWDYADWKLNFAILNSLVEFPQKYSYSIFVFTPDDTVISRDEETKRVRDNVLFEFGLFVGQKDGTNKAFVIHPKDKDFVLATDIKGIYAPAYDHSHDREILKNRINAVVNKIVDVIDKYESSIIEQSEQAIKTTVQGLRESLARSNEYEKVHKIIDALKDLVELKGRALNQTASEVLNDILSWTNTVLDIVSPDDLAVLQKRGLKKVWVYSSVPIEFNQNLDHALVSQFKKTVTENLENGVHYTYFTDSDNAIDKARSLEKHYPGLIEICKVEPYCLTSNFAIHFFSDSDFIVYQNVIRKGNPELLIRLDDQDAKLLVTKIQKQHTPQLM